MTTGFVFVLLMMKLQGIHGHRQTVHREEVIRRMHTYAQEQAAVSKK